MDTEITARTGLETATGIEIDNPALSGDYYITYHAVGGIEGQSNALVADLIEAIEVAKDAPINWNKLLNVPAQFPPEWHPHEVSDLNGLEVVSQALSNLERAILDSRPLQISGNNLHWQDERILNLISIMMDRINAIYALVLEQDIDALVDAKVAVVEAEYDRKLQIIIGAIDWGPNGPPDLYPDTDPDPDPDEELYPGLNIYDAGGISGPSPVIPGSVIEPDIVDVNGDPNGGTGELYPGDIVYDTGTTLGQSTLIAGAELEPDTVDLNPAP